MPDIGIRELKIHTSEIIKNVREERARYTITYRGQPVAILIPLAETKTNEVTDTEKSIWEKLVQLGERIGRDWQLDQTSTELLSEIRR